MKKIFTLLFSTAMLSTAFAQYGQKDRSGGTKANDVYVLNNGPGYGHNGKANFGGYVFTAREKDMQIAAINREYNKKIQAVKSRFLLNAFMKMRQVKALEAQRDNEIQQVMYKFNSPKNQFVNHGRKDKKRW